MPTVSDLQQEILYELGAQLPGGGPAPQPVTQQQMGALQQLVGTVWNMNAAWSGVGDLLQFYFTKRQCCDLLLGQLRDKINGSVGGLNQELGQKFDHLDLIRRVTQEQIDQRLKRAQTNRQPLIAPLLRHAPVDPGYPVQTPSDPSQPLRVAGGYPWFIDPNSPILQGFPWGLLWGAWGSGIQDYIAQAPNLS